MKKFDWKDVKGKCNGVKQFGKWYNHSPISCIHTQRTLNEDKVVRCQVKRCTKKANWMTTIKGIGLIFLCFGHGEDA
jgi:hypothetical protein